MIDRNPHSLLFGLHPPPAYMPACLPACDVKAKLEHSLALYAAGFKISLSQRQNRDRQPAKAKHTTNRDTLVELQ